MQSSLFFESLFKRTLTNSNAEFIKQLAVDHPYFSPAQFYLLEQTDINTEAYTQQAAKTSALFNNPYWLNFQILRMQQAVETTETITPFNAEAIQQPVELTNTITTPVEIAEEIKFLKKEELQQPIELATTITTIKEEDSPAFENKSMQESAIKPLEEKISGIQYATNVDEKLLFEPLFARDYFASQGIKISEEILTNDKLGKQLKSFTDWLKTMKKIAPDKIQAELTQQTDSAIQTLAEKSNAEGETVTETMADIFMQQGKADKAIETYEKLSLLNPAKSAYFAAKIEQLKEH